MRARCWRAASRISLFCFAPSGATENRWAKWRAKKSAAAAAFIAQIAVLAIMVILLGVVALVIVNALKSSPWATFTLAMTIPIALLLGLYLRFLRPGRVLEASLIGVALVLFAVVAGQWVADSPSWARAFTIGGIPLAGALIVYAFAASALPVWLLLAPRDYLSAFIKAGAIFSLAAGILLVRPHVLMPPLTRFIDGSGPVFAGKIFPFCFITIACGAISGFHSLISSGTTPKMILRESHARFIGYGAMLLESFVGVMAMVAACAMPPGVYFAINSPVEHRGRHGGGGGNDDQRLGLSADGANDDGSGAQSGRNHAAESRRRRAFACGGHGADFFEHHRRRPLAQHLVSLRDHVRGAVYFDGAGCGDARRAAS